MTTSAKPFVEPSDAETEPATADATAAAGLDPEPAPPGAIRRPPRPALPERSAADAVVITRPLGTAAEDEAAAAPPPVLEGYQIVGRLGSGGMGTVWRAWQLSTRREVALKLLKFGRMASDLAKRRFDREVEVTSRLQHPHLARVYDSGIHEGVYYYAMELIEGVPLDTYVRNHHLDRRSVLKLMIVICRAMQHAHQRGVIHRDLKPSNVLVDAGGEPHIVDFGLGKSIEAIDSGSDGHAGTPPLLTIEGEWAGTPLYMSPEQAAGRVDQLDTRTDVYSLGVMLYQLLTGRFPHDAGGGSVRVLRRILDEDVIRPRRIATDIDAELEALLLKALSKHPDERYAAAGALADDLENYLQGEPLSARAPTALYFMRKKLRKHRLPLGAAAAVLIGLVSLGVYGSVRVAHERDVAAARARGEAELRALAEIRLSDSLSAWGETLASSGQWLEAGPKFADARALSDSHGVNPVAADLGLLDVYEHAPFPVAEFASARSEDLSSAPATGLRPSGAVAFADDNSMLVWLDAKGMHRRALPAGVVENLATADVVVNAVRLLPGAKEVIRVVTPGGADVGATTTLARVRGEDAAVATGAGDPTARILELVDLRTGTVPRRVPLRGQSDLMMIAISPDGRHAADICFTGADVQESPRQLVLYDLSKEPGDTSARVVAEGATVSGFTALTFSGDGKQLIAGGPAGRLAWWNANTAGPAAQVPGVRPEKLPEPFDICRIIASPGGDVLALASQSGGVALKRVSEDGDTFILDRGGPGRAAVNDIAFSDDGIQLGAGDAQGRTRVWDVRTRELTHTIDAHAGGAWRVAFSPDGQLLATFGADQRVRLWAVRQQIGGRPLHAHKGAGQTSCLALSEDGRLIAIGYTDCVVDLADVESGQLVKSWRLRWPIAAVAFAADGATLRASTSQSSVFNLSIRDGAILSEFTQQPPRALPEPTNPNRLNPGENAFSVSGGRAIHFGPLGAGLWDVQARQMSRVLDRRPTDAACFIPSVGAGDDGAVIAVTDGGFEVVVFDNSGVRTRAITMPVHARTTSLAVSPDGHVAIVGDQAGELHALDLVEGRWTWNVRAHASAVRCLAFSPDRRMLLSGGADGILRLVNASDGRTIRVVGRGSAGVRSALFSGDGRRILATVGDGQVTRVWDLMIAERLPEHARAAAAAVDRPTELRFVEKLSLAEWYGLQGRQAWAAKLIAGAVMPKDAGVETRISTARCLWGAGDLAAASEQFTAALGEHPAASDVPYLTLCREAASRGEP